MTFYNKYLKVVAYNCDTNTPITDISGYALVYDQTYNTWYNKSLSNGVANFTIQGNYAEVYIVKTLPDPWPPSNRYLDCSKLTYPDGYIANPCLQSKSYLSTNSYYPTVLNYCLKIVEKPIVGNLDVIVFKDNNKDGSYNDDDKPIPSVYITLRNKSNNICTSVLTDADGKASFNCIVGISYEVYYTNTELNGTYTDEDISKVIVNMHIDEYIPSTSLDYSFKATSTKQTFYIGFAKYNQYPCKPVGYVISGDENSILYEVDIVTGNSATIGSLDSKMNALAYNPLENILYAFDRADDTLYRIEPNAVKNKVKFLNIPESGNNRGYYLGTFDDKGIYYFKSDSNNIYKLNLNPKSPKYGTIQSVSTTNVAIQDFVWHQADDSLYSFEIDTTTLTNSKVIKLSQSGTKTVINTDLSAIPNKDSEEYYMLSSFKDYKGFVYFMSESGTIYRTTLTFDSNNNPVYAKLEKFAKGFASSNADGANCIFAKVLVDYGNAPENGALFGTANYKSKLINEGPRHTIIKNLSIGDIVISEDDAIEDDGNTVADNDGPTTIPLNPYNIESDSYTINVNVKNNTGKPANLYGWLDFNKDGKFNVNEFISEIVPSVPSGLQTIQLTFKKPSGLDLTPGNTFIRLRLTTQDLEQTSTDLFAEDSRSLGAAIDGEVEDYILGIYEVPTMDIKKSAPSDANIGDTFVYTIKIENKGSSLAQDVLFKDPDLKELIDSGNINLLSSKIYIDDNSDPENTFPLGDFINGFNLGDIAPGSIRILKFEVKVLGCN